MVFLSFSTLVCSEKVVGIYPLFEGTSKPKSAKDLEFIEIKAKMACELNAKWHSVLPEIHWSNVVRNKHYICFGAIYDWRYYAVGIWSSPISRYLDGETILELRRLAIAPDSPKFTASRMISQMIKTIKHKFPSIKTLVSYQDKSVHDGTIYKASNWTPVKLVTRTAWDVGKRKREVPQTKADKTRWEYYI